jgi:integrase
MSNEKLSAKTVAKPLPKGKTDHIIFDTAIPGFGLRIRDGGTRTWLFQYKLAGSTHRMNLGRATAIKPEDARREALRCYNSVQQGGHPAAAKALQKVQAAHTMGDLVRRYLAFKKDGPKPLRPRSHVEVTRHLEDYSAPLHKLPVASIDRTIIRDRIAYITNTSGAVTANRVRTSLSAMFRWGMFEGLATSNPVAVTHKNEERARDRVLSDEELIVIWKLLGQDSYGDVIKLLALTGARAAEIAQLRWLEIDFNQGLILLPAERVKNKRPHQIPVSTMVRAILEARPRIEGRELVFSGGPMGFSGWSASKNKLNASIAAAGHPPLPHWTPHDLRRTCASGMARLGIALPTIEKCLNHTSGSFAGIVGVYQRHSFADEMRVALNLWADHIAAILDGRKSNVTPLKLAQRIAP